MSDKNTRNTNFLTIEQTDDSIVETTASINAWAQIPFRFFRFFRRCRPRHIYSTALLFYEFLICILFGLLLKLVFHSHTSRQHYIILKTFAAGAQTWSAQLRFQADIDQLEADKWFFVIIVASWMNFLSALCVIFIGFFVPCLIVLFGKLQKYRKTVPQKVKYDNTDDSDLTQFHLLQIENDSLAQSNESRGAHGHQRTDSESLLKKSFENNNETLEDFQSKSAEDEPSSFLAQQFYKLITGSKFSKLFHSFLLLIFVLQTVALLSFVLAFSHLIATVTGKLEGEILTFIENTAERNPDGFLIVQIVFECCGFAMKAGGINHEIGECQYADETINCTEKITGQVINPMELIVCAAVFILICFFCSIVIYKCRWNIRKEIKKKKNLLMRTKDILSAPQLQEISDPVIAIAASNHPASDHVPVAAAKSDSQLIVAAIVHDVRIVPFQSLF